MTHQPPDRACRKARSRAIPFDCKLGAGHAGECSPYTLPPSGNWMTHGHGADRSTGPDELETSSPARPAWITGPGISATAITAAFRTLLPRPIRLRTDAMAGGDFQVTTAAPAAGHLHVSSESGRLFVDGVLTRQLGAEVHIADVRNTKRTVNGQSTLITVRPGPCAGPDCRPPAVSG